jgi:hypothetical protein
MEAYLPDGAWWAILEEGADAFLIRHHIKGVDANDAVHFYLAERK